MFSKSNQSELSKCSHRKIGEIGRLIVDIQNGDGDSGCVVSNSDRVRSCQIPNSDNQFHLKVIRRNCRLLVVDHDSVANFTVGSNCEKVVRLRQLKNKLKRAKLKSKVLMKIRIFFYFSVKIDV